MFSQIHLSYDLTMFRQCPFHNNRSLERKRVAVKAQRQLSLGKQVYTMSKGMKG